MILNRILFIGIFYFFTTLCLAQNSPKKYVVYHTVDSIKIDGIPNEKSWKLAEFSDDFIDIEGIKKPEFQTNFKMLWDEKYLYFFARLEEPNVWATLKQCDTVIFYNNDFEIFIDPDGDTHNYIEFEMNALNTVWDLFIVKPYREGAPVLDNWDIIRLKSAVKVNGSINNPNDADEGWTAEIAFPWQSILEASPTNKIPEDKFWRINFSRVNWDFQLNNKGYSRKKDSVGNYLPEHNWVWSPQGVVNMHEPEHWGYVYFSENNVGKGDSFSIPVDEKIKWYLYELYRNQKGYFSSHKKWATDIQKLTEKPKIIDGKEIHPLLQNHLTGWNILVTSPFTTNKYVIKEDGKLIQLPDTNKSGR